VIDHDPIEELGDNLWRVEGALPGMALRRVMTVARMKDGRLVIHNGIALGDAEMKRLEDWGTPAVLVVPNGYHRLDAPAYKQRYPDIQVLCPAGSRKRVQEVVAVDGDYDDFEGDDTVSLKHVDGVGRAEGVMVVRSSDGVTIVFNDMVFNCPHGKGAAGFIFRYLADSTGGPRVSRLFRLVVVKDRAALRRELERLADTPQLKRIVVSHQDLIDSDAAGTLRAVAARL
jgi:hypothetical protein